MTISKWLWIIREWFLCFSGGHLWAEYQSFYWTGTVLEAIVGTIVSKNKNNEQASLSAAEDATRPVRDDSLGSCPRL